MNLQQTNHDTHIMSVHHILPPLVGTWAVLIIVRVRRG